MTRRTRGERYLRILQRCATLADEGWDIPEITELLTAEGVRQASGEPLTDRRVYGWLWDAKTKGLWAREGMKDRNGKVVFVKKYPGRTRRIYLSPDLLPQETGDSAPGKIIAVAGLAFVGAMVWAAMVLWGAQ